MLLTIKSNLVNPKNKIKKKGGERGEHNPI